MAKRLFKKIEFEGEREIKRRLDKYRRNAPETFSAALYERAVSVMTQAKKLTPVDTGRLRASAFVSRPQTQAFGGMEVVFGYGTDYAERVHEDTSAYHEVGEAKFLKKAMNLRKHKMPKQIAKAVVAFMKTGTKLTPGDMDLPESYPARPNPTASKAAKERGTSPAGSSEDE